MELLDNTLGVATDEFGKDHLHFNLVSFIYIKWGETRQNHIPTCLELGMRTRRVSKKINLIVIFRYASIPMKIFTSIKKFQKFNVLNVN